jgi:hypothetical protein
MIVQEPFSTPKRSARPGDAVPSSRAAVVSAGAARRRAAQVRRGTRTFRTAALAALCLLVTRALGGPSILLTDGREIKGDDLRMEGDLYMLTVRGTVVPIPKQAVKAVQWVEDTPSKGSAPIANMVTSKSDADREADAQYRAARKADVDAQVAAEQQARDAAHQEAEARRGQTAQGSAPGYVTDPQGIQHWNQGVTLAGPDIRPPTTQEQLAVFGEPAHFAPDVVQFDLHPTYWVPDPTESDMQVMPPMAPPRNDTWVPTSGFAK